MTGLNNGTLSKGHDTSLARGFGTLAVHAGAAHDAATGAVIAPVSCCERLVSRPKS